MKKGGGLKRYFVLLLDGVVLKFKLLEHIQEYLIILTTPHLEPFFTFHNIQIGSLTIFKFLKLYFTSFFSCIKSKSLVVETVLGIKNFFIRTAFSKLKLKWCLEIYFQRVVRYYLTLCLS